jgi:hypothetical protein
MQNRPKQITAAELSKAYDKLKCEPLRMEWIDVESRKCAPFVALMIAARRMPAREIQELFAGQTFEFCCKQITYSLHTHISYVAGFELGFAALTAAEIEALGLPAHLSQGEEFESGYADGQVAGRAFV